MLHARSSWKAIVVIALVLSFILSPNVVQAQATPDQAVPQISVDLNALLGGDPAVADEVAETVAMRESLSPEQVSSIQAILDSHKSQLQQITDELLALDQVAPELNAPITQGNNVFIPFANGSANTLQNQTEDAKAARLAALSANAAKINQISQKFFAVQSQIDQQVVEVLDATQRAAYEKTSANLKSMGQAAAANVGVSAASEQSPDALSNCFYGAIYAAYAAYYAYYSWANALYDYYYYGNVYANASYFAATLARSRAESGLLYAGGAYFDSAYGFGYDSNGWADRAYSDLLSAETYSYYTYYGYYSYYYYSSSYGYWAYYYGLSANTYADYASNNEYYCS